MSDPRADPDAVRRHGPNEGLGIFGEPVDMAGVPKMTEQDRWELADITGDGAAGAGGG